MLLLLQKTRIMRRKMMTIYNQFRVWVMVANPLIDCKRLTI